MSKKKEVVFAMAKYHTLYYDIIELSCLMILVSDLSFGPKKPTNLFCDDTTINET